MNLSTQLVVFFLDDQRYALQLDAVERTVRMVEIAHLPRAPEIVLGAITIQGRIVPVLDLRGRFRLPPRPPAITDQLLIARTRHRTVALIVDGVSGVVESSLAEIVGPAAIVPGLEYVTGVTRQDDGLVFIHDLDGFLSLDEEQTLAAAMGP